MVLDYTAGFSKIRIFSCTPARRIHLAARSIRRKRRLCGIHSQYRIIYIYYVNLLFTYLIITNE